MYLYRVTNNHETRVDRGGHAFESGETKEVAVENYRKREVESCSYFDVELLDDSYELESDNKSDEGKHSEVVAQPATESGDAASPEQNEEQPLQNEEQKADSDGNKPEDGSGDVGEDSADEVEAARKDVQEADQHLEAEQNKE